MGALPAQMVGVFAALGRPEPFQLLYAWGRDPPAARARPGASALAPPLAAVAHAALVPADHLGEAPMPPDSGVASGYGATTRGAGAAAAADDSGSGTGLDSGSGHPGSSPPRTSLLQRWAAAAAAPAARAPRRTGTVLLWPPPAALAAGQAGRDPATASPAACAWTA